MCGTGETGTVLAEHLFTCIQVLMHMWSKFNWYGSSCTYIHVYSNVDAHVEQVKPVQFYRCMCNHVNSRVYAHM